MRPRRRRSSMNRVEIMAGVGIHDPLESREPRGEAAAKLWDVVLLVMGTDGVFELKRSRTRDPIFD